MSPSPSPRATALALAAAALAAGCLGSAPTASPVPGAPPGYSGRGGMTAHRIAPAVYVFHYEHGFTGPDAMGWDPDLQFAWSRIGAAKTCGLPVDADALVQRLIERYGHDRLMHELNGIEFHHLQSKGVPQFCTAERVAQLQGLLPKWQQGGFAGGR